MNKYKINKLNTHILFDEYYSFPLSKWNDYTLYLEMSCQLANNLQFIYEFRNKINFSLLYTYKLHIKNQIIEDFVSFYSKTAWTVLLNNYSYMFNEEFINKHYMYITVPIPFNIVCWLDRNKLSDNAKFTLAMLGNTL